MCATCGCHHTHHDGHQPGPGDEKAVGEPRSIDLERALLAENDAIAAENRRWFRREKTLCVNLWSSPGAGKTTLLERSLPALCAHGPVAVIEGDQQTTLDQERLQQVGVPAVQIQTGMACHLDAAMVREALASLPKLTDGILLIENVGNLICPASFDLGEHKRVVLVSVTEGEDKPLKYPTAFARAELLLVSKTDLLPHLEFSVEKLLEHARRIRPNLEVILLSARTGAGLSDWLAWLLSECASLG